MGNIDIRLVKEVSMRLSGVIDESEFEFKFVLSSGPGGQNINKVATAVQLRFNIRNSFSLPPLVKSKLLSRLEHKLTKKGEILIHSHHSRSQAKNREIAIKKLYELLEEALVESKKRIPTQPSPSSKTKRLEEKKHRSEVKKTRGPVKPNNT